jgi:DNA-binding transcriptional MerR regulator
MAHQEPISRRTLTGNREIPDKLYFRIGEVAQLCDVPAYVLRFWETEFAQLRPNKGGTGQRLYRRRDVEMALRIKTLLYDEGYTIPGARQVFKSEQKQKEPLLALGGVEEAAPGKALGKASKADAEKSDPVRMRKLRREMQELLTLLSKPLAAPPPREALRVGETFRVGSPVQSIRDARSPRPALETSDAAIERLFEEPMMFPD